VLLHAKSKVSDNMANLLELSGKGKAIILVVDGDPHIRDLEAYFLQKAGYSVVFEKNGDGALEQARKTMPDIVITEILVPKLDGLALCRRLKADRGTRDIAVLVFSILSAADRAREAGADAFLLKPFAEHRMVSTVRRLLDARSARPEKRMSMENAT
jgi:two-component system OmpR family response regulator